VDVCVDVCVCVDVDGGGDVRAVMNVISPLITIILGRLL
jgi:hypothetical protein